MTVLAAVALTGINLRYPVKYLDLIAEYSGSLQPSFVCAVINTESGFRPLARSSAGAEGLMQLTEGTAAWMAETMNYPQFSRDDVWEPSVNIAIGCYFLQWLEDYYKGDTLLTLCAYNAGIGNVNRWLKDEQYSADGVTLTRIPFPETAEYVRRVEHNKTVYDILLGIRY